MTKFVLFLLVLITPIVSEVITYTPQSGAMALNAGLIDDVAVTELNEIRITLSDGATALADDNIDLSGFIRLDLIFNAGSIQVEVTDPQPVVYGSANNNLFSPNNIWRLGNAAAGDNVGSILAGQSVLALDGQTAILGSALGFQFQTGTTLDNIAGRITDNVLSNEDVQQLFNITVTAVPEPSSYLLLCLLGVAIWRRRSKSKLS